MEPAEPPKKKNPWQYFTGVYKKYAVLKGRAGRAEFWWFNLFFNIFFVILPLPLIYVLDESSDTFSFLMILILIGFLLSLVPIFSLAVRRMHDCNKSGAFMLVPVYGLFLLLFVKGSSGPNRYDPVSLSEEETEKLRFSLNMFIVIMLGISTICTSWSSWKGSIHNAKQDEMYAQSNFNMTNIVFNDTKQNQQLFYEKSFFRDITIFFIDWQNAKERGNQAEVEILNRKAKEMFSEAPFYLFGFLLSKWRQTEASEGIDSWKDRRDYISQIDSRGQWDIFFEFFLTQYMQEYWDTFNYTEGSVIDETFETLEGGKKHSEIADYYGFATVMYAVVLFLLGISNTFNEIRYKKILVGIASVVFSVAFLVMLIAPY